MEKMNRVQGFLTFLALTVFGQYFIINSFKFLVYDLTQSKSAVSVVGSIAAISFMLLGTFSGTVVDAISRRFFVYFQLIGAAFLSATLFGLVLFEADSIWLLFAFILIHEAMNVFSSAAKNSIFYDLCGEKELSKWISYRSIIVSVAVLISYLAVNSILTVSEYSLPVYLIIIAISLIVFMSTGYKDQNTGYRLQEKFSLCEYIIKNLFLFIRLCKKNRLLGNLLILSFLKTVLIFWPMSSGVLFQIGIEQVETQRVYLFVIIFMELVSIVATYFLGKYQKFFTIKSFIVGIIISGAGILFFGLSSSYFWMIFFLSFLYIGLAISQMSSSFLLRMELPKKYRTQGLSFAVIPYYLADFCSGFLFALLLNYFSTQHLLTGSGTLLIILGLLVMITNPDSSHSS